MSENDGIMENLWSLVRNADDVDLMTALTNLAGKWECPFCGSDRMTFFPSPDGITKTPLIGKVLIDHEGSIPTLVLSCGNCGYMADFWPRPIIEELVRIIRLRNKKKADRDE